MRITLTQNKFATIDDEDYEVVSKYKWHWIKNKDKPEGYAGSRQTPDGKWFRSVIRMHRLIMGATEGQWIDHINGDCLDNRKKNLRFCNSQQNQANMRINKKGHSSKYRGVYFNKVNNRWIAVMSFDGKNKHLGCFTDEKEAALCRDKFAKEKHGEFAILNFPGRRDET